MIDSPSVGRIIHHLRRSVIPISTQIESSPVGGWRTSELVPTYAFVRLVQQPFLASFRSKRLTTQLSQFKEQFPSKPIGFSILNRHA